MSTKNLEEKAKAIRLVIFDVDGVLTNGQITFSNDGQEYKSFNIKDGLGFKLLKNSGIEIAIITSRSSQIVSQRMSELGITHVFQGQAEKLPVYNKLITELGISDNEVAYVGDDLPDLPIIQRVGFSITVQDATKKLKEIADWTTNANGGYGAAREVCEFIMTAQNTLNHSIEKYLSHESN